jgi:hypothetical protein
MRHRPAAARAMNVRIELLISAISWLTVIALIAAIIADALR